jgi:hypothetical protein
MANIPLLNYREIIYDMLPVEVFTDDVNSIFHTYLKGIGDLIGEANAWQEEIQANLYLETADWRLTYWEQVLELPYSGTLTDDERRTLILCAILSLGISVPGLQEAIRKYVGSVPMVIEKYRRLARWGIALWGIGQWSTQDWIWQYEVIIRGYHQDLATMESTESWTGTFLETSNVIEGYASRRVEAVAAPISAAFSLPITDLTTLPVGDGTFVSSPDTDAIMWFVMGYNIPNISSIELKFRSTIGSDVDYFAKTFTLPDNDWQLLIANKNTFSSVGSPNWNSLTEVVVTLTPVGGETVTIFMDALQLVRRLPPNPFTTTEVDRQVARHRPVTMNYTIIYL